MYKSHKRKVCKNMYFRIRKKNKHKLDDPDYNIDYETKYWSRRKMKHLSRKYQSREKKWFWKSFVKNIENDILSVIASDLLVPSCAKRKLSSNNIEISIKYTLIFREILELSYIFTTILNEEKISILEVANHQEQKIITSR